MNESLTDRDENAEEHKSSSKQPWEGPSGLGTAESAGGAEAVPDAPGNVPADDAE